jgi:signal transduction histidine kinase
LALAYGLSLASIMRERQGVADTMMRAYVARDLASSVGVLDRLPVAERATWLAPLSRPNYRLALGDELDVAAAPGAEPSAIALALAADLRQRLDDSRVRGLAPEGERGALIRLRLADGTPLAVHLAPPMRGVNAANAALLLAQLAVLGACVAWAVRLATRPLAQLAQAEVLPSIDAADSAEVQRAHSAFQAMQARIREHMAERLQLLAAISHDLQTPITRLRLRTEALQTRRCARNSSRTCWACSGWWRRAWPMPAPCTPAPSPPARWTCTRCSMAWCATTPMPAGP